ncbi:MAG: LptF/LptG family permease [Proteobacteria bacterium]|nr:LptF/LptG family permease [Pseudomonadota bacterium]
MNSIINKYLIIKFIKIILNTTLIFFTLGIILNLFEEINFLKNSSLSFLFPLTLALLYVPSLILDLLPFIIFLSSVFYFLHLRFSKELVMIKVFGYSNLKIILILSFFSLLLGLFVLFAINPITARLIKQYEIEKARYSKDVDHLISINKNGVWIKETDNVGYKIINAKSLNENTLENISIYIFDSSGSLLKRIESETALITNNPWQLKKNYIHNNLENSTIFYENYELISENTSEKINSLYKNLNTIPFLRLITNYQDLNKGGYSNKILNEKLNKFTSLPIFLFLMVVLAGIFTIGSLKNKQNFYYLLSSILICVVIYYLKDLSIALGQTEKINLTLSIWMPIIIISLFCSIGIIQINEK